jgi:hypothetical protein
LAIPIHCENSFYYLFRSIRLEADGCQIMTG